MSDVTPRKRNFFPKAKRSVTPASVVPLDSNVDTLPAAIDSTEARKGNFTVARRRFQRGSVFQNRTKTQWRGTYSEYVLDASGVEQRVRRQLVLSPVRKADGSSVRKNEAKNLLQPYINRANEQLTSPSRERKSATFEAFSNIWESDYLCLSKPSTRNSVKTQLKTLRAEFGQRDMRLIDAGDVQRLIAKMTAEGYQPKTIRNLWGTVSLIWQAALAQRYVDAVLPKPKLPKLVKKKPRFFTLSDVARIIALGRQSTLYWLLAETGLRAGEIAGLRVQDVALDRITVNQSVWAGEEQTPKTQSAVRQIAISPQLAELLWKQVERQKAAGHSFLFSVSTGSPLDMDVERRRRLKPTLKALEIPKAGYHAFRHFNVSVLDSLRVPLKTIQERIGHALTGSFTLDVYGHTLDWKSNEEAAQKLGDELAQAVAKAVDAEKLSDNSDCLTAIKKKNFHSQKMEVF
jgi:integrase